LEDAVNDDFIVHQDDNMADDISDLMADDSVCDHVKPSFAAGVDLKAELGLLKILKDVGAPLESFPRIMNWAFQSHSQGYKFNPDRHDYSSQIHH
jgi:hypothetical protein